MSIRLSIDKAVLIGYADDKIVADVDGSTIGECLDDLMRQHPIVKKALLGETGELKHDHLFVANGDGVLEEALARAVKDGDKIEVIRYGGG